FGFTGEQVVADFTERILRAATAGAVQLLHDQCEAGKDMMRLMSDLISYLRDLLVFKVKPDALDEDVDLDLRKSLAMQAELVETDRLLELIDQLAEAESRMKWAPNKKLHFEVAVIKAIQSLGQATLDEVIEKLGELRDGKTVSHKKSSRVMTGGPAQSVAGIGDAGREESRIQKTGGTAPGYRKERVESDQPNSSDLWQKVLAKIPAKSFLRTLSE